MLRLAAVSVALAATLTTPAITQEATLLSQAPLSQAPIISEVPMPAQQTFCGSRDVMVEKLAEEFKENPMALGMVDQNAVLEIFVSQQGSWTIIATDPNKTSCVISAGEGWQSKTLVLGSDV